MIDNIKKVSKYLLKTIDCRTLVLRVLFTEQLITDLTEQKKSNVIQLTRVELETKASDRINLLKFKVIIILKGSCSSPL